MRVPEAREASDRAGWRLMNFGTPLAARAVPIWHRKKINFFAKTLDFMKKRVRLLL